MHKDCIILCNHTNKDGELSCLQEINGKPFIEYVAEQLKKYHICKIIFAISHKKEEFKKHLIDNRDRFYFAFDFAEQEEDASSGQLIINALQYSDTPDVFIMNGHQLFDLNLDDFIAWQQTKMGDVTIALSHQESTEGYTLAHLNEENVVHEFSDGEANKSGLLLAGMYCMFRPSFLNVNFPHSFSFEKDYLKKNLKERDFIGMISEGYFLDISKEGSLDKAIKDFQIIFKPAATNDTN